MGTPAAQQRLPLLQGAGQGRVARGRCAAAPRPAPQPPQLRHRVAAVAAGRAGVVGHGRGLLEAARQVPADAGEQDHLVHDPVQPGPGPHLQRPGQPGVHGRPVADRQPVQAGHDVGPGDGHRVAGPPGGGRRGPDVGAGQPLQPGRGERVAEPGLAHHDEVGPPGPLRQVQGPEGQRDQRRLVLQHPAGLLELPADRGRLGGPAAPRPGPAPPGRPAGAAAAAAAAPGWPACPTSLAATPGAGCPAGPASARSGRGPGRISPSCTCASASSRCQWARSGAGTSRRRSAAPSTACASRNQPRRRYSCHSRVRWRSRSAGSPW